MIYYFELTFHKLLLIARKMPLNIHMLLLTARVLLLPTHMLPLTTRMLLLIAHVLASFPRWQMNGQTHVKFNTPLMV